MPGIHQYFETDFAGVFTADFPLTITIDDESAFLEERIILDFAGNVKYIALYIPEQKVELIKVIEAICSIWPNLLKIPKSKIVVPRSKIIPIGTIVNGYEISDNEIEVEYQTPGAEFIKTSDLYTSGKLYFYTEGSISSADKRRIFNLGRASRIFIEFRDEEYAKRATYEEQPIAFISHDSRDKQDIVRPLVTRLQSMMIPLWYDEYSLNIGDNLRESIEKGLKVCERCILVLSPNFLGNIGWTKVEFDAIFSREIVENKKLILPIWVNVTARDVHDYSMALACKFGLNWSLGVDEVAKLLFRELVEPSR